MLPPNPWLLNWCHPPSISLVSILGLIPVSFLALFRVSALSLANVLCLPKSAFPTRDLGFKLVPPTLFSLCFRFGSTSCFRSRPSPCFRPMVGPRSVPPQSAFPTRELVLNWCHSPSLVLVSVPALILVPVPALIRVSVPSLAHVLCLHSPSLVQASFPPQSSFLSFPRPRSGPAAVPGPSPRLGF